MSVRFLSVLVCVLGCSISSAEEIPLDQIWSWKMPGTRDIRELEKDREPPDDATTDDRHKTLTSHALHSLNANNRPPDGGSGEKGFVVVGKGHESLLEANEVLSKKKRRKDLFPAGEDLTLVFFSYSCPRYVWIDEVVRKDNIIVVKYHFHAHGQRSSRANLALIPLGKITIGELPLRKVEVEFERLSDTSVDGTVSPLNDRRAKATVCDSFSFGVTGREK